MFYIFVAAGLSGGAAVPWERDLPPVAVAAGLSGRDAVSGERDPPLVRSMRSIVAKSPSGHTPRGEVTLEDKLSGAAQDLTERGMQDTSQGEFDSGAGLA